MNLIESTSFLKYRSQRDGVIETRIEKRYPDGGQSHSVDYDKVSC